VYGTAKNSILHFFENFGAANHNQLANQISGNFWGLLQGPIKNFFELEFYYLISPKITKYQPKWQN